jgi:diguanylate cyclase (GGDEF)-like protein/putative nucleotidyltransferase with HDIG domain
MFRLKPAARLALTIGFVCLSLILLALGLGLIPDPAQQRLESRLALVRSYAASISTMAENSQSSEIGRFVQRMVSIEPDLHSIGLRLSNGKCESWGKHEKHWVPGPHPDQVSVDIFCNSKKWGKLEVSFRTLQSASAIQRLVAFPIPLIAFLFSTVTLVSWYVLAKTFHYLNPSNVVPDRVRNALDSICSGLVMVTPKGEIAHANKAFGRIVNAEGERIVGQHIDCYQWSIEIDFQRDLPWHRCCKFREAVSGEIVQAKFSSGIVQKYMVSASPIFAATSQFRGVLVSFEDVTALEAKKSELSKVIQSMRLSRDEVQRQNEQLHFLANFDPLTRCFNRRSFYTEYEKLWSQTTKHPLSLLILDIDHFKKINDNYGHSTGDEVLRLIGELLNAEAGAKGVVCRYGGEEFIIVLPNLPFEEVVALAERIRSTVESKPIAGLKLSVSVGVSNKSLGAMDGQHLLDQADESLYVAKRAGRNQVVRYDRKHEYVSKMVVGNDAEPSAVAASDAANTSLKPTKVSSIEYSSVTGLLSALSFRSQATAEHSIRVADLAVDIARSLLDSHEIQVLEIAGLLHDVGKIGVPDSILNKPTKLTSLEWEIMQRHDEIGVTIVRAAFANTDVANIIEKYYQVRNGIRTNGELDGGKLSLCGKILHLCDAFDSMLSGAVYRAPMAVGEAMKEILNNTPQQFDTQVVVALAEFVKSGRLSTRRYISAARSAQSPTPVPSRSATLGNDDPSRSNDELERLAGLADEVMSLYHETRASFDLNSHELQQLRGLSI